MKESKKSRHQKHAGRHTKSSSLQVHFFIMFDILQERELCCTLVASGSGAGGRYFKNCRTHTQLYYTGYKKGIDKIVMPTCAGVTLADVVYFEVENST